MYSVRNKNTQITHSKENLAKIGQTGIGLAVLRDIQPGNVNHYHSLSLSPFNGHFPGESGSAGAY